MRPPRFHPGGLPGPGRPRGSLSGRSRALAVLDRVAARPANLKALETALQAAFDQDPLSFWRSFIVPLLPRDQVEPEALDTGPRVTLYLPDNGRDAPPSAAAREDFS